MEEHILFLLKTFIFIGFILAYVIYKIYQIVKGKENEN